MSIIAIACIGRNRELGKNNGLIFNLKQDMRHFREVTANAVVVCGYNTLLSFPKQQPLPGRTTFLLCPENIEREDCICYHNFEKLVHDLCLLSKTTTIYIIGGGMVYTSMLPYCDELILTEVEAEDSEATVFFPEYKTTFMCKPGQATELCFENDLQFRFVNYIRS